MDKRIYIICGLAAVGYVILLDRAIRAIDAVQRTVNNVDAMAERFHSVEWKVGELHSEKFFPRRWWDCFRRSDL